MFSTGFRAVLSWLGPPFLSLFNDAAGFGDVSRAKTTWESHLRDFVLYVKCKPFEEVVRGLFCGCLCGAGDKVLVFYVNEVLRFGDELHVAVVNLSKQHKIKMKE